MMAHGAMSKPRSAIKFLLLGCLTIVPFHLWGQGLGNGARIRVPICYVDPSPVIGGAKTPDVDDDKSRSDRRLLTRIEPEYPETLRNLKIGGIVRLTVTVSASGKVEDVELLGGNPILAEAAAKAVRQWIYAPGPSRTKLQVTIRFHNDR